MEKDSLAGLATRVAESVLDLAADTGQIEEIYNVGKSGDCWTHETYSAQLSNGDNIVARKILAGHCYGHIYCVRSVVYGSKKIEIPIDRSYFFTLKEIFERQSQIK
jgi:hypothetical protein